MNYPSNFNHFLNEHVALLNNSHRKFLGEELILEIQPYASLAQALFYAPFVVVSHNSAADPVFNYANRKALELFEFDWEEFIQLPSRLSAEPIHRLEREQLLSKVSQNGYLINYQGIRVAKNGRRFLIKNATVWNLFDVDGCYLGQAARFKEWEYL
jgi:MEKHLA domain